MGGGETAKDGAIKQTRTRWGFYGAGLREEELSIPGNRSRDKTQLKNSVRGRVDVFYANGYVRTRM